MSDADRIQLSFAKEVNFGEIPRALQAKGTLTMDTQPGDGEEIVIDGKTYTWQTVLTDVDGNIAIGGSLAQAKLNLIAAIDLSGTAGVDYAASMTAHPTVEAAAFSGDLAVFTAKQPGTAGNSIVTTTTMAGGANAWDSGTLGTTQAGTDQVYKEVRITSESLIQETATVNSAEIRQDRQIAEVVRTNINASGEIAIELSSDAHDDFIESALQSAGFSTPDSETDTDFSFDPADNSINRTGGDWTAKFFVFQWVKITGATNQGTKPVFAKLLSVTALKMVLGGPIVVTEAAGAAITVLLGGQALNGVNFDSYSIQKEFTDKTGEFEVLTGMGIDTMSINVATDAIITGAFGFLGKRGFRESVTRASSVEAAPTENVMNAVDDVLNIFLDNVQHDATEFTLALANNLRQRSQIGSLGPISIGSGTVNVSGSLNAFFEDKETLEKYLGDTEISLAILMFSGEGDAFVFEMPRAKLTAGATTAGGQNTDILEELTWEAFRHATEQITIRVVRFPV